MVENLASKALAWEKERGIGFTYDGVRAIHFPLYVISAFQLLFTCLLLLLFFYADPAPLYAGRVHSVKERERTRMPPDEGRNMWHFLITFLH